MTYQVRPLARLKPFSQDLLFFDTEFTSLDPHRGEILSFGAVKLTGEELYVELEHEGLFVEEWPREHVLPRLTAEKLSRLDAVAVIQDFIGTTKPTAVAFVDNYDNLYTTKLFTKEKLPFDWLTIDFASILFSIGYDPRVFLQDSIGSTEFYMQLGINPKEFAYHHALGDARLLREVWMKFFPQP